MTSPPKGVDQVSNLSELEQAERNLIAAQAVYDYLRQRQTPAPQPTLRRPERNARTTPRPTSWSAQNRLSRWSVGPSSSGSGSGVALDEDIVVPVAEELVGPVEDVVAAETAVPIRNRTRVIGRDPRHRERGLEVAA